MTVVVVADTKNKDTDAVADPIARGLFGMSMSSFALFPRLKGATVISYQLNDAETQLVSILCRTETGTQLRVLFSNESDTLRECAVAEQRIESRSSIRRRNH